MRKDASIVLKNIKNDDFSKLHFVAVDYFGREERDQNYLKEEIKTLKKQRKILGRVCKIINLCTDYSTFDKNNEEQCREGANRSTVDILRIYNNYFRPISIFTLMRILYKLVIEEKEIDTLYCHDIDKQVFFSGSDPGYEDLFEINELGVRFAEWRTIRK